MAATAQAARLTEIHRLAQARLGAQTAAQMVTAWGLLDPENLDGTVDAWLRLAVPVLRSQKAASARLASAYLTAYRNLEVGTAAPAVVPRLADTLDPRQALTSLTVTGPVRVKLATARGVPVAGASQLGRDASARAAMRLVLDGGRATIVDTLASDPSAHGWARATSGSPCAFCAMLASRGPSYSEETAGFEAHDGCSCSAEPVYDPAGDWPAGARQYQDLWKQAKAADGDTTAAFRQLVESGPIQP